MRDSTKANVAVGAGIVGTGATYHALGRGSPKKFIVRAAVTGGAFAAANHYAKKDFDSHMKAPVTNKGRAQNRHPNG